jgi:hypothetical protein
VLIAVVAGEAGVTFAGQDPGSKAAGGRVGMEGAGSKKFAPVAAALQPGVPLGWTQAAAHKHSRL